MEGTPDTILVAITKKSNVCKAGLPPNHLNDKYHARAIVLGKMNAVKRIAFSPEGELFAIRGKDLYHGQIPSDAKENWFSTAKKVGTVDWDKIKFLLFHPDGTMYAVTNKGELYKGPPPDNDNVSWLYRQAIKVGQRQWETLHALFFDNYGSLFAVTKEGKLVARLPPVKAEDNWHGEARIVGEGDWRPLSHFITFGPDGYLWCVHKKSGDIYRGLPPTAQDPNNYLKNAEKLGWNYNQYPRLAFTVDKVMQSILSFEFLPDSGKVVSLDTEVVQSQVYRNSSDSALKHTFSFSKTLTETSTFSQEHGFSVGFGIEMSFKAGIPIILEFDHKVTISTNTTHTWTLTETNTTQITFSSSTDVEVPARSSIRMTASVLKGIMNMQYRAKISTMFGYETYINGVWNGVTHYNLMVSQEDHNPQYDSDSEEDYIEIA